MMAQRVVPVALRFAPLLALALVAAGCGRSKERGLYDQREAACATVQGLTISAARTAMHSREDLVFCNAVTAPQPLLRIDQNDLCGGAPSGPYLEDVCQVYFLYVANDPALCNDSTGCTYGCETRVNASEIGVDTLGNPILDDTVICAKRWVP